MGRGRLLPLPTVHARIYLPVTGLLVACGDHVARSHGRSHYFQRPQPHYARSRFSNDSATAERSIQSQYIDNGAGFARD